MGSGNRSGVVEADVSDNAAVLHLCQEGVGSQGVEDSIGRFRWSIEDEAESVSGLVPRRSSMESPQGQIISLFNQDRQYNLVGNANVDVPGGFGVLGPLYTELCIPPPLLRCPYRQFSRPESPSAFLRGAC